MITEHHLQRAFSFIRDKGGVIDTVGALKNERDKIEIQMIELISEFKSSFRPPWKSHLAMQRVARGGVYLRWRAAGKRGKGQTFFELFDSDRGKEILDQQSDNVLEAFLAFEKKRIELNLTHSLTTGVWLRLRKHMRQLDIIERHENVCSDAIYYDG